MNNINMTIVPALASGFKMTIGAATGPAGLKGDTGDNGTDGLSSYTYIAYALDDQGTGFTTVFDSALDYIAIKTTSQPIANPQASDFVGLWKNYKGSDGTGSSANGVPAGGEVGQQLVKKSIADYDTEWKDIHAPISTTTVTVDTPIWTNQPTIEGSLNVSFVDGNSDYYFVTLKDAAGNALPAGQFKLTPTLNSYSTAIDQIFTLANLATGNSGTLVEGFGVEFYPIGADWRLRDAMAIITILGGLTNVHKFKIIIDGYLGQNWGTQSAYNNTLLLAIGNDTDFNADTKVSSGFNNINLEYTGSLCKIIGVMSPGARVENKSVKIYLTLDGVADCTVWAMYESRMNLKNMQPVGAGNTYQGRILVFGSKVQLTNLGMSYHRLRNGSKYIVEVYE